MPFVQLSFLYLFWLLNKNCSKSQFIKLEIIEYLLDITVKTASSCPQKKLDFEPRFYNQEWVAPYSPRKLTPQLRTGLKIKYFIWRQIRDDYK